MWLLPGWYMLIWMQVMWLCKIRLPEDVLWFGRDIYWSKHVTRNWHIKQLKQKNKCDCQFSIAIMFFRKFVYDELALSFSRSILIQNNFLSTDNHSKYWKLAPRILIPILQYFNLSEVILLLRYNNFESLRSFAHRGIFLIWREEFCLGISHSLH